MSHLLVGLTLAIGQVGAPSPRATLLPPTTADAEPSWVSPATNPRSPPTTLLYPSTNAATCLRQRPTPANEPLVTTGARACRCPRRPRFLRVGSGSCGYGPTMPGNNVPWVGLPDPNGCVAGDFDWALPRLSFCRRLFRAYFPLEEEESDGDEDNHDKEEGKQDDKTHGNGNHNHHGNGNGHCNGNGNGNGKKKKEEEKEPEYRRGLPAPLNPHRFPARST